MLGTLSLHCDGFRHEGVGFGCQGFAVYEAYTRSNSHIQIIGCLLYLFSTVLGRRGLGDLLFRFVLGLSYKHYYS